jgi:hypothetical protein
MPVHSAPEGRERSWAGKKLREESKTQEFCSQQFSKCVETNIPKHAVTQEIGFSMSPLRIRYSNCTWWCISVIPATQKVEARGS